MNDPFVAWKMVQDQMVAAHQAQMEAAQKVMTHAPSMDGAMKAAQDIAEANHKAWDTWMAMWGVRK